MNHVLIEIEKNQPLMWVLVALIAMTISVIVWFGVNI